MLLYCPNYLFKRDVITSIASFEPPHSKKLSFSFRIPCLYFSFDGIVFLHLDERVTSPKILEELKR